MNRISKEPKPAGSKIKLVGHASQLLKDSRAPKKEDTPYIAYGRERWASGDFKDVRAVDASRSISKEWNAMSPDAKRVRSCPPRNVAEMLTVACSHIKMSTERHRSSTLRSSNVSMGKNLSSRRLRGPGKPRLPHDCGVYSYDVVKAWRTGHCIIITAVCGSGHKEFGL